jgi:bifunctional non-homologous end joining protein LigD
MMRQLGPLQRQTSPLAAPVPPRYARGVRWVEPRLVGEVAFAEWTADGSMRHPSWRGLLTAKPPGGAPSTGQVPRGATRFDTVELSFDS